jgi:hypothetical protein
MKKKKLPNIILRDYSLKNILETLFDKDNKKVFFDYLYEEFKTPKTLNKREITIGLLVNNDMLITIPKSNYKNLLKSILDYFLIEEDYNKCSYLQKLILKIEENG